LARPGVPKRGRLPRRHLRITIQSSKERLLWQSIAAIKNLDNSDNDPNVSIL
jgi:hypothetical protein